MEGEGRGKNFKEKKTQTVFMDSQEWYTVTFGEFLRWQFWQVSPSSDPIKCKHSTNNVIQLQVWKEISCCG